MVQKDIPPARCTTPIPYPVGSGVDIMARTLNDG